MGIEVLCTQGLGDESKPQIKRNPVDSWPTIQYSPLLIQKKNNNNPVFLKSFSKRNVFLLSLFKRQKMNVTTETENRVKWSVLDVNIIYQNL